MRKFPNSPLETLIFEMLAQSHLEMPDLQHEIYDADGFVGRPDFVYVKEKVIIEGHSKLHHTGHYIEKKDLAKHRRFVALGYRPLYVTWADTTVYRAATLAKIDGLLADEADLSAPERAGVWLS